MNELTERLEQYIKRLKGDLEYEMSEEMQEEYFLLKEELEMGGDFALMAKFDRINEEYETPDNIIDATLSDMYPNSEDDYDV